MRIRAKIHYLVQIVFSFYGYYNLTKHLPVNMGFSVNNIQKTIRILTISGFYPLKSPVYLAWTLTDKKMVSVQQGIEHNRK